MISFSVQPHHSGPFVDRDSDDPPPLNAATLNEKMACLKEKSDGREAL